ncbi:MAG TPA: hemerythrin domain-containing protein [Candidatus Acidoferrales bacterium]|jgi:hemerythrin superfamily protein|nr:hemerythrin domain-containing protein [Candidatus Acidoferrales bacterium]
MAQDALTLLVADHRKVEDLFRSAQSSFTPADLDRITISLARELTVHAKIEEEMFYPAVRERSRGNARDQSLIECSYVEHAEVRELVAQMQAADGERSTILRQLQDAVEEHNEEEENDLFPEVRRLFDADELALLGSRMAQMKEDMLVGGLRR